MSDESGNGKANGAVVGGNICYPLASEKIDWLVVVMKKAALNITAEDRKTIEGAL